MSPTAPDGSPASLLHRIHGEVADLTRRMSIISGDVATLESLLAESAPAPADAPTPTPTAAQPMSSPQQPAAPSPTPPPAPPFVAPPAAAPHAAFAAPPFVAAPFAGAPFVAAPFAAPPAPPFVTAPAGPPPFPPGGRPYPVGLPPAPRPYTPPPPRLSMSERIAAATERGLVGTVLAIAGVAVTLTGVVFLLVLAAQAGLLRPEIRVAGGALLAAILFGAGLLLGRRDGKRSAAGAVIATGVTTALFDVLAATAIYHWFPGYVAVILAAAIAAGGLAVAHVWNSQALGLMVGVALIVFAPFLSGGPNTLLVGFLLAYAAATMWIQLRRNWTALYAVNTVAVTLPLIAMAIAAPAGNGALFVVAALVNVLLALGSSIVLMRWSTRTLLLALFSVVPLLPLPGANGIAGTLVATVALSAVTVLLASLAVGGGQLHASITVACRTVWLTAAAVTALAAVGSSLHGTGVIVGIAGLGLVVAVASCFGESLDAPIALTLRLIGSLFTGAAVLATLPSGALQMLFVSSIGIADQAMLLAAAVLSLVAVGVLVWSWSQGRAATDQQIVAILGGLIALFLVTEICVFLGGLISGGSTGGIRGGHAAATIVWVLAAAAGLLWARRLHGNARGMTITVSLAVIAAAIAKLFLFDLAALDGVFRVIAFIVVGLLLLSLGAAYAQSLGSPDNRGVGPQTHGPQMHGPQAQTPQPRSPQTW
jgi:uncharacterized membrane protein